MDIFLIAFALFYLFVAINKIDWAVWLILFLLPTYQIRFSVLGVPLTLLEAMILISFGVWFLKNYKTIINNVRLKLKLRSKKQELGIKRYPFDVEIVFLLVISFVAIVVAGFSNASFGIFKAYIFEPLLFYILLFNTVFQKKDFSKILWPLAISAFVVSLVAVFQKFGLVYSPENFLPRVTGVFTYPNALGLYLGPLVMLMIGWLSGLVVKSVVEKSGTRRYVNPLKEKKVLFLTASLALSFVSLFLASSEGAIVGVGASLFIFLIAIVFSRFKKLRFVPALIVIMMFVFVLVSPIFFLKIVPEYSYPDFKNQTVNKIYDKLTLKDFSGEVRKQQWRETFAMMKGDGRWFKGVGFSGYKQAVSSYHQEGIFFNFDRDSDFRRKLVLFDEEYKAKHWHPVEIYLYPHNLLLNFWVEIGLLGVLIFVYLFAKILYSLIQNIQHKNLSIRFMSLGLLGVFVVMMIHGMVDVPFFKNDLAVMFWVFVAMVGVLKK